MELIVDISDLSNKASKFKKISDSINADWIGEDLTTYQLIQSKEKLTYDLILESQGSDILAVGSLKMKWTGQCRRCLENLEGKVDLKLKERFCKDFKEGETYPLGDSEIDLAPMLLEAVILALPMAPLCSNECKGPVHEVFIESSETQKDTRWDALDIFQEDSTS